MSWREKLAAQQGKLNKPEKKAKKYKNEISSHAGFSFGSKLEAAVYDILFLRMKAGEFEKIQSQDSIYLTEARIQYVADFKCTKQDGSCFWVESKGMELQSWRIKLKLWRHYGPGDLEIWKGNHKNPFLHETVKIK